MDPNLSNMVTRLERSLDAARKCGDGASMEDLSHILRLWTEAGPVLTEEGSRWASESLFNVPRLPRSYRKIVKKIPGVAVCFGKDLDVPNRSNNAPMLSGPDQGKVHLQVEFRPNSGGTTTFRSILVLNGHPTETERHSLQDKAERRMKSFEDWLGSGNLLVTTADGKRMELTRSVVIKRIANTQGGSHIKGAALNDSEGNRYDPFVYRALELESFGLSIPHLLLLEYADEIMGVARDTHPCEKSGKA